MQSPKFRSSSPRADRRRVSPLLTMKGDRENFDEKLAPRSPRTRFNVVNEHTRYRGRQIRWPETYDRFGLSSDCLYSPIKSSLRTWNMGRHDLTEDYLRAVNLYDFVSVQLNIIRDVRKCFPICTSTIAKLGTTDSPVL